jgi:large subunit ribosomal protein L29
MSISAATLRDKQIEDLSKELSGLLRKRLQLSMSKASGEFSKTHEIKQVRKNIARILTIIEEKKGNKL